MTTTRIAGLITATLVSGTGCGSSIDPVPAEGRTIVDVQAIPAPAGLYVATADGSGAVRLTAGNRPSFSPDGRRIVFDRDGEIRVIAVDGSNDRALARGVDAAWSPDGSKIVFAYGDGPFTDGIAIMNADGTSAHRLISVEAIGPPGSWGLGKPAWSPDGRHIAFEHYGDDVRAVHIWVVNADGSDPHRLTPRTGVQYAESDPAWSPDGEWIAFWSWGYGIALARPDGGSDPIGIYRNFPFVSYGARPAWSPDGLTLLFTAGRFGEPGPISIYRIIGNGTHWSEPVPVVRDAWDPSLSGDGKRMLFVAGRPAS